MVDNTTQAVVLEGLDPQQRAAVLAAPGPVRILAGAGTGKTRTITRRIAYLALSGQVNAKAILAVTHSRVAAGELRDRITSLGVSVQARTFHSAAMKQLSYFWAETNLPGEGLALVERQPGGQNAVVRAALQKVAGQATVATTDVTDLRSAVQWAKRQRVTPARYTAAASAASVKYALSAETIAKAYEQYEELKRSLGLLDYDDIIEQCSLLLEDNGEVADRVRGKYRCFVVDEFQDTDPAQARLLAAWLGSRDNVTVVGDPHQTIYSFKGADPAQLIGFTDQFPDAVSISLDRDYRSTPQIVGAANRLMADESTGVVLKGQRSDGPEPVLRSFEDETEETHALAERIHELIAGGTPPSEIAVLVRTNSQVLSYRAGLQDAGVVTEVFDEENFFERRDIREAMRLLDGLAERDPERAGLVGLQSVLRRLGFDSEDPSPGLGAAREEREALGALLRLAIRMPDPVLATVCTLASELRRRAEAGHAPRGDGDVTLATMHKAKGLEWDVVLLPGLTEGFMPISYADEPKEVKEELRLLYVAVTRARERLELSYPLRSDTGRTRKPSHFLAMVIPPQDLFTVDTTPTHNKYGIGDRVLYPAFGLGKVTVVGKIEVQVDFGGSYGVQTLRVTDSRLSKL
jgi:DNA helicase-2/ATP-dependent DNA helicase PcrA